eukprot:Gb_09824 [translate_table: standard]
MALLKAFTIASLQRSMPS